MKSINFDDGLRSFSINGDPTRIIRINPADIGIMQRLDNVQKTLKEEYDKLSERKEELTYEEFFAFSDMIKSQLNYLFASDVADTVLAGASPLATVNGEPLVKGFLDAVAPVIEGYVREEAERSESRIKKYTEDLDDDRLPSDSSQGK